MKFFGGLRIKFKGTEKIRGKNVNFHCAHVCEQDGLQLVGQKLNDEKVLELLGQLADSSARVSGRALFLHSISAACDDFDISNICKEVSDTFGDDWSLISPEGLLNYSIGWSKPTRHLNYLITQNSFPKVLGETHKANYVTLKRALINIQEFDLKSMNPSHSLEQNLNNTATNFKYVSPILGGYVTEAESAQTGVSSPSPANGNTRIDNTYKAEAPIKVTVVTRTKFRNFTELQRTIKSVRDFTVATGGLLDVRHLLVSSNSNRRPSELVDIELMQFETERPDDRFELIQKSIECILSDYVWYLDDDDWIEVDQAIYLASAIGQSNKKSMIVLGSRLVFERGAKKTPGHFYKPQNLSSSIGLNNGTPFCSVIFPVSNLKGLEAKTFADVVRLEDHFVLLYCISRTEAAPIYVESNSVSISVKNEADHYQRASSYEKSRTINKLARHLILGQIGSSQILAVLGNATKDQRGGTLITLARALFSKRIFQLCSSAWQLGLVRRIFSGNFTRQDWIALASKLK